MFKKIELIDGMDVEDCPCDFYSLTYVKRVAKQILNGGKNKEISQIKGIRRRRKNTFWGISYE